MVFFPSGFSTKILWLYSPILGLDRLHESFRFISVTRARTPWAGDQLVARPLLTAPGNCDDDGEVGEMNGFVRGNRSTRRKPPRRHFVHHKSHLPDTGANPDRRGGKPATNCFSYGAAISPKYYILFYIPHACYMSYPTSSR
jgi:hypothetical protein